MCELLPVVHGFLIDILSVPLVFVLEIPTLTDLVFLVCVEDQDIESLELLDVSMSLVLLSDLGSEGGNGHVQRVHLLNLGALSAVH